VPFVNLQMVAKELRCSVMEAAAVDPEWRYYAELKLLAQMQAGKRLEQANGAT
jgi:hypothetical protein